MLKDELELVFPTKEHKKQVEEYLQEFLDNGENEIAGDGGLDRIKDFDKWLEKIQNDLSINTISKDRIPATLYLTVRKSDKKIVGILQIRHFLNAKLLKDSGHIGDSVRPSERRKGYATEQIKTNSRVVHTKTYTYVYRSFAHNLPNWEATKISFNKPMDR